MRTVLHVRFPTKDILDIDPSSLRMEDGCTYATVNGDYVLFMDDFTIVITPQTHYNLQGVKRRITKHFGQAPKEFTRGEFYHTISGREDEKLILLDEGKTVLDYMKSICVKKPEETIMKVDPLDLESESEDSLSSESEEEFEFSSSEEMSHDDDSDIEVVSRRQIIETETETESESDSESESESDSESDEYVSETESGSDSDSEVEEVKIQEPKPKKRPDGLLRMMFSYSSSEEDSDDLSESDSSLDDEDFLPFRVQGRKAIFRSDKYSHVSTDRVGLKRFHHFQKEGVFPPVEKVFSQDDTYHILYLDVDRVALKEIDVRKGLELINKLKKVGFIHRTPHTDIHQDKAGVYYFTDHARLRKLKETDNPHLLLKSSEREFIRSLN